MIISLKYNNINLNLTITSKVIYNDIYYNRYIKIRNMIIEEERRSN